MRQFSTALAHELRTPLTALRGDIEMAMLRSSDEAIQARAASQLEDIDKLTRLIEQLLLLARAEAGEIPLRIEPVDLTEIATSLVDEVEPLVEAKAISLACECAERVVVQGDGEWLRRMVLNLLDNAIKFTPRAGWIRVKVSAQGTIARLAVEDGGVGITAEDKPHVFERFYRADPARSSRVDGVGFGLSLVKWIVERHHGRIDVDSRPGHGSTFTVQLPAAAVINKL
jgi:signal transduction histidine kinase